MAGEVVQESYRRTKRGSGCDLAKERQEVAVWLPQLPGGGRTRWLCARDSHRSCQPERNDTFRSSDRWCAYRGESGVCGQGIGKPMPIDSF